MPIYKTKKAERIMEKEDLFKLLEITIKDEHFYMGVFRREVSFFWSIISAITAGTIVALFKASQWEHYLYLSAAPILLFLVTVFMKKSIFRTYQRFIETIASRAKIESLLGFDSIILDVNSSYWPGDSLLMHRHIGHRNSYENSDEFIKSVSGKGVYKVYSNLIACIRVGTFVLFVLLLAFAIYLAKNT